MAQERVRVSFDLDVTRGSAADVAQALFEERENIISFAGHVIVGANDALEETRVELVGANSHIHPTDPSEMPCAECRRYAGRTELASVGS